MGWGGAGCDRVRRFGSGWLPVLVVPISVINSQTIAKRVGLAVGLACEELSMAHDYTR